MAQQGASTYASNSKSIVKAIGDHVVVTKTDIDQEVMKGLQRELLEVGYLQELGPRNRRFTKECLAHIGNY